MVKDQKNSMRHQIKMNWQYFLTAVMFFTRIPVKLDDFDDRHLNKSTRFFPLVGMMVGGFAALVFWLADLVLPIEIAVLLSMVASILLTGAFHEDGLADAIDGLGGGWSREQVLTIMVDSRIGSYGAIGLVMVLLIKYQTLSYQSVALIPAMLVAGHALSRLCAVLVMATQTYAKTDGKAKPLATQISQGELLVASVCGVLPFWLLPAYAVLSVLPVGLVWWWFSAKIKTRIGGYTGDCLGAMQQLTEVSFYVAVLSISTLIQQ